MSKEMIGLKLADGEFYPVLEDAVAARKRLVVTTVQDGQRSVQIDLYRGTGKRVEGAEYIGSLVIEDIPDMPKGEPDIRMDLGLTEDGTLTAFAQEASTGASQSLKVSLRSLAEEEKYEIPDFKFSGSTPLTEVFEDEERSEEKTGEAAEASVMSTQDDSAQLLAGVRDESDSDFGEKPRSKTGVIIAAVVAAVAILAVLGFLLLRPSSGAQPDEVPMATSQAEPEPAQTPAAESAPESTASAESTADTASASQATDASAASPEADASTSPAETSSGRADSAPRKTDGSTSAMKPGVHYKIKWGDTLWELSYAFYRNPWYFGKIALANGIKNPDRIIAGRTIWIPPL
jgi:nucleoid-associated protein YgaU